MFFVFNSMSDEYYASPHYAAYSISTRSLVISTWLNLHFSLVHLCGGNTFSQSFILDRRRKLDSEESRRTSSIKTLWNTFWSILIWREEWVLYYHNMISEYLIGLIWSILLRVKQISWSFSICLAPSIPDLITYYNVLQWSF